MLTVIIGHKDLILKIISNSYYGVNGGRLISEYCLYIGCRRGWLEQ